MVGEQPRVNVKCGKARNANATGPLGGLNGAVKLVPVQGIGIPMSVGGMPGVVAVNRWLGERDSGRWCCRS